MHTLTILPARAGQLDQGVLFGCACAEDYPDCRVHGLLITARCDFSHSKTRSITYLPVVRLVDWLHRDFQEIVCNRARKDIDAKLRRLLEQHEFSPNVVDTEPPERIMEALFPSTATTKRQKDGRKALELIVRKHKAIETAQRVPQSETATEELIQCFGDLARGVLRECMHQSLAGYYFLPSITPIEDRDGFVVLLREVRHMPRVLAGMMANGLGRDKYASICAEQSDNIGRLSFRQDDFAQPIGRIRSPEIEHLMQMFALLFTRIGVTDPDPEYVSRVQRLHATGSTT